MANFKLLERIIIPILAISIYQIAGAFTGISVQTGGGYSGNLYADSFGIGDSYILGAVSISDIEMKTTRFKIYYDLVYYEYDTRNSINQFDHLAGLSLFRSEIGEQFKWGVDIADAYRDYTDENSDYDNNRFFLRGNAAYYLIPGLQLKFLYQLESSSYSGFDNLNNLENRLEGEVIKTFRTRTTARTKLQYFHRAFSVDNSNADWFDIELKLSQSIDLRTGVSGSGTMRFAGNGTRPLSSYYYISGVSPYWDPWDGYQLNLSVKRIFPWGIIGIADFDYWDRTFNYSLAQQNELPWLAGTGNRHDKGWQIRGDITRQFNLYGNFGRAIRLHVMPGYVSNDSDDPYYNYDYLYLNATLEMVIF